MSIVSSEVGDRENKIAKKEVIEQIDDYQPINSAVSNKTAQADALSALKNLGFTPNESAATVAKILHESSDLSTEELIRNSLKMLGPKG